MLCHSQYSPLCGEKAGFYIDLELTLLFLDDTLLETKLA
jgi:hypothetical protein